MKETELKRYVLDMPTSRDITDSRHVVVVNGHPYMAVTERVPNERNQYRDRVHLLPFEVQE